MAKENNDNRRASFQEGMQDNTVKLSADPKISVTNQDRKLTNEDEQRVLTEETDEPLMESTGENPEQEEKPRKAGDEIVKTGDADDAETETDQPDVVEE